jgi:hypothetical protein
MVRQTDEVTLMERTLNNMKDTFQKATYGD